MLVFNLGKVNRVPAYLSLLLSSIISMMMRLLLDVSICFCLTPELLLVVHSTSLLPYLLLHCPSISSIVFLGFFSHWYSSVMLLLAAVRFPFLIHVRTNLVCALLFCQPVSFLDIEYHAQSHFSSYHVLLLSTIFLIMSFLSWGFVFHLLSSCANILNRAAVLELRRFHSYSFTLVLLEMLADLHSLLNCDHVRPNTWSCRWQFCDFAFVVTQGQMDRRIDR